MILHSARTLEVSKKQYVTTGNVWATIKKKLKNVPNDTSPNLTTLYNNLNLLYEDLTNFRAWLLNKN